MQGSMGSSIGSAPTIISTLEDQKFKSFQMLRNNVPPSLENGGKTTTKLETKTTMKSSATTTAILENQKN